MVEQIMIFVLGFLCAGLMTLLFLPAFWRRAMTLSKRRLEMQMPLSMAEIVAERDQLRAEFAADQRRLEQRLEAADAARAGDKLALGQRIVLLDTTTVQLAAARSEAAETARTLQAATRAIAEAEAELSTKTKQIYDYEGLLDRRDANLQSLMRDHETLTIRSNEQRASIAGLETRLAGREAEIEDLDRTLGGLRVELLEAHEAAEHNGFERDQFRADARQAQSRREALQRDFEAQARRVEELQGEIRIHDREKTRAAAASAALVAQLDEARQRTDQLYARISAHDAALKSAESRAAQELEAERAGKAAIEGALEAQRREYAAARQEIASLREALREAQARAAAMPAASAHVIAAPLPADLAALRKAIATVGAEIASAAAARHEKEKDAAPRPAKEAEAPPAAANSAEAKPPVALAGE